MARSEKLQQLDRRIAQSVLGALSDLRDEIRQRLREHTDSIEDRLQALEGSLPESFLGDEDIEPLAQQAAESARQSAFADLHEAIAALDRARSQAAILGTFLESCGAYASRAAVFLTRAEAVQGWGGYGFASDAAEISGLRFGYGEGSPWARMAGRAATLELSTGECAQLCSQFESAVPSAAVLIPIVLNDRLAGAVYADRLGDDGQLEIAPIQLLAYVAAQAIETLPFRQQSQSATLVAGDAASVTMLPLWDQDEAAQTEPAASPADAATATQNLRVDRELLDDDEGGQAEVVEEVVDQVAAAAMAEAETDQPSWRYEEAESLPATEALTAEPMLTADAESVATEELGPSQEEIEVEARSQVEEELTLEPSDAEVEVEVEFESGVADAFASIDGEVEAAAQMAPPFATTELERPGAFEAGPTEDGSPEAAATDELSFDISSAFDEPSTTAQDEPSVEAEPPSAAPLPDIDVSEDETILVPMAPSSAAPAVPPPAAEPPARPPQAPPARRPVVEDPKADDTLSGTSAGLRGGAALVQPPSDIQGPGSAFRTAGAASTSPAMSQADEAAHEEARRLARLLVSEIRLYYEDQVQEGRRNRDIYRRLREDIDRSRRMYEERVAEPVRETRDYFHQELVRILADGDEGALGL